MGYGGIVDQDVHRTELLADGLYIAQVAGIAERGDTKKIPRRGNEAGGLFEGDGVMAAVENQFCEFPGTGAGEGDCPADTMGSSGNQNGAHQCSNTVITPPMLSREETWDFAFRVSWTSKEVWSPTYWR